MVGQLFRLAAVSRTALGAMLYDGDPEFMADKVREIPAPIRPLMVWVARRRLRLAGPAGRRTLCVVRSASCRCGRGTMRAWPTRRLIAACAAVIGAAIVAMIVAACGGTDPGAGTGAGSGSDGDRTTGSTPSADPEAIELSAELIMSRRDEANGRIRIRLTNLGEQPVPLDTVRLVAEPYSPEPARINTSELRPGGTVAYPVIHGEPACEGEAPTVGPVMVEVVSDGRQVSVDPGGSAELIDRILALSCARQKVAELVSVALADDWSWAEGAAEQTGTLVVTRLEDGPPVELTGVRGGVNFGLEQQKPEPVVLGESDSSVEVPVRMRAARCEGHAVADNSKPYTFTVWLSIDGGPEVHVAFSAVDQRENLDRLCVRNGG